MKLRHMHTFGCHVFALQNELAAGGTIPHWLPRARLGVNLGPSPSHACNVFLKLNLHMGCVSPQFHCRFDNFFKRVKHGGPDISIPSVWQQLAGLVTATKDHLWSSTTNLGTSSDMLLSRMHFPLQQVTDLQSLMTSL
jgi:hypothetical protein